MEEEKKEEPKEEKTKPEDLIKSATEAAERLEQANKKHQELLNRQEKMHVKESLGGKSEAAPKEKTKEELETEGARKLIEGSGFEEYIQ